MAQSCILGRRLQVLRLPVRALFRASLVVFAACSDGAAPVPSAPLPPPRVTPTVANVLPAAQFAVSPRWPAPGDTVTFDGRYSHDSDGQVLQYRWSVSNGVTLTSGATARTVFRTAGTYTVSLTAIDDSGDSTTTTLSLPVGSGGAPSGAVSASQSRLTLAASSVGGGATVVATVVARTSAGAPISGVPVAVSAAGRRVSVLPLAGTTDGAGTWATTLLSGVAQATVVRAVANFTALVYTVPLTITPASVTAASAVRLSQPTLASAADSALVEVTVRDTAGNPVSGAVVTVTGSPAGIVATNEGTTDASGRRIVTVRSNACGVTHALTVVAGGVTLAAAPTLQALSQPAYTLCGAVLWLDASDATTYTTEAGARVTQWRDKSPFLRHASAATGSAARPTYSASAFNGRPAMVLAGGSSATATPEYLALPSFPGAAASAVTWFAVYRRTATSSCDRLFDFGSGTSLYVFLSPSCGSYRYSQALTGGGSEVTASSAASPAIGAAEVATVVHGATALLRSGGATIGTSVAIAAPSALGATSNNWIGRSQYPADGYLSGQVAELLAFPRSLTAAEYVAVEHALMAKWGVGVFSIASGDGQSATAGTSPSSDPQVRIVDAMGLAVPGATVTFQVTGGGGRVNGGTTATATTDASGYAKPPTGTWKLDYGTNALTAWFSSSAGAGQSVTFTATGTLPANLVMQYDASASSAIYQGSSCTGALASAAGDSVGCWKDLTSNARHVTQATNAARPLVSTFGSTGRLAIRFALARETFLQSTASGLGALANGPRTIVAVANGGANEDNATNNAGAVIVFPGMHSGIGFYGYPNPSLLLTTQYLNASTLAQALVPYTSGSSVVATQVVTVSGGSFSSQVVSNGGATNTSTVAGTPSGYANLMRIGEANTGASTYRERLNGQVAEIMVFSRALSAAERLQVERYMGWKWGVTVP